MLCISLHYFCMESIPQLTHVAKANDKFKPPFLKNINISNSVYEILIIFAFCLNTCKENTYLRLKIISVPSSSV